MTITLATTETLRAKAGTAAVITCTISGDEIGTVDAFKTVAQAQLGTGVGTLYTVPASKQAVIKQIHLANTSASPVTGIAFYIGGTAGSNQILGGLTIPANGSATYSDGKWTVYDANGLILIGSDYSAVHVSGAETIAGVKTFTSPPVVPGAAFPESAIAGLVADLAALLPRNTLAPTLTNGTGTAEIVVAQWSPGANYFAALDMLEIKLMAQASSTATLIWRVRCGALGTTADPLLVQFNTTPAGVANQHVTADILVSCLTAGASGTITAGGYVSNGVDLGDGVGPANAAFAAAAIDTTVARKLSITVQQSSSQTLTVRNAALNKIRG